MKSVQNKMIKPQWENLPEVITYTKNETIDKQTDAPLVLKRDLDLVIEVITKANDELEAQDILDDISWEIEQILSRDHTLCDTASDSILNDVHLEYDENGESPIAACILSFRVRYLTCMPESIEDQDQVNLADFKKLQGLNEVGNERGWDLFREDINGLDGVIDAEDIINIPID